MVLGCLFLLGLSFSFPALIPTSFWEYIDQIVARGYFHDYFLLGYSLEFHWEETSA